MPTSWTFASGVGAERAQDDRALVGDWAFYDQPARAGAARGEVA
jgi:hypothetical protein